MKYKIYSTEFIIALSLNPKCYEHCTFSDLCLSVKFVKEQKHTYIYLYL